MADIFDMDGSEGEAPGLRISTRQDLLVESGPYHDGILLEAAQSSKNHPNDREAPAYRIKRLLTPPRITHPNAPYNERMLVMWRMLRMIPGEWSSGKIEIDGWLEDPRSQFLVEYLATRYVDVLDKSMEAWELHMDTANRTNTLVYINLPQRYDNLDSLLERHQKEDIFGDRGFEVLLDSYKGWKLPLVGIHRVIALEDSRAHIMTRGNTEEIELKQPYAKFPKKRFLDTDGSLLL